MFGIFSGSLRDFCNHSRSVWVHRDFTETVSQFSPDSAQHRQWDDECDGQMWRDMCQYLLSVRSVVLNRSLCQSVSLWLCWCHSYCLKHRPCWSCSSTVRLRHRVWIFGQKSADKHRVFFFLLFCFLTAFKTAQLPVRIEFQISVCSVASSHCLGICKLTLW